MAIAATSKMLPGSAPHIPVRMILQKTVPWCLPALPEPKHAHGADKDPDMGSTRANRSSRGMHACRGINRLTDNHAAAAWVTHGRKRSYDIAIVWFYRA